MFPSNNHNHPIHHLPSWWIFPLFTPLSNLRPPFPHRTNPIHHYHHPVSKDALPASPTITITHHLHPTPAPMRINRIPLLPLTLSRRADGLRF